MDEDEYFSLFFFGGHSLVVVIVLEVYVERDHDGVQMIVKHTS